VKIWLVEVQGLKSSSLKATLNGTLKGKAPPFGIVNSLGEGQVILL